MTYLLSFSVGIIAFYILYYPFKEFLDIMNQGISGNIHIIPALMNGLYTAIFINKRFYELEFYSVNTNVMGLVKRSMLILILTYFTSPIIISLYIMIYDHKFNIDYLSYVLISPLFMLSPPLLIFSPIPVFYVLLLSIFVFFTGRCVYILAKRT